MSENENIQMLVEMLGAEGKARILRLVLAEMTPEQKAHLTEAAAASVEQYFNREQFGAGVRPVVDAWVRLNVDRLVAELGDVIEEQVRKKLATGLEEQVDRVARETLKAASREILDLVNTAVRKAVL